MEWGMHFHRERGNFCSLRSCKEHLLDSERSNLQSARDRYQAPSDRVDLPGQATVLLFLEHFCEHNPSSNVYNGAVTLLQSQRRSGLEHTQAVITGRMRVRKTTRRPIGS